MLRPNELELSRAAESELGYLWEYCSHQKKGIAPGTVGFSAWLGPVPRIDWLQILDSCILRKKALHQRHELRPNAIKVLFVINPSVVPEHCE
jgi:hypothetical protein